MIFRKQDKQYDNEVSTFDASFALFIMSVGIITLNSLVCIGTMMYTNYNYTSIPASIINSININSINNNPININSINNNPINNNPNTTVITIDKNLFTGIWYKIDSNYSNLHIYQNNDISFKNESNTELVNGYIDYKSNLIYMSGGGGGGSGGSSNNIVYNISYVHRVNNAYSFTILYDKACKKYYVYRKYDYVVNIAFITKLVESLQLL
jgi:hypothetical protein